MLNMKRCKKCNQEKPLADFRYGRRTCLICEALERKTPEYRAKMNANAQERRKDPEYQAKTNAYHQEWHRQRMLNDPNYRQKRNASKREHRRRKRVQDPKWIPNEINKLMKECKRLTALHEFWQRIQENKKRRASAAGKKALLNRRLKGQRQHTADLTDGYIKRKLCHRSDLRREDIPKALIELKRAQMILNRTIKERESKDENDGRTKKSTTRYR